MAYLYLMKIKILQSLAYRFEVISTAIFQVISLVVTVFLWRAVYAAEDTISGTTLSQMLVYTVMSGVLSCFFSTTVEWEIRGKIRKGDIALDYIKPMNPFSMYFAQDIGGISVNLMQKAIPLTVVSSILVVAPVPVSLGAFLLFLLSSIVSFCLLWFISALFGVLNFSLVDIGPLSFAKDLIIKFLSGAVVPVWFFPDTFQRVMKFTPFMYIYQTPLSIYIGKISLSQGLEAILIQSVWVTVFFAVFVLVKNRVIGKIIIQGG